jgi:aldehyde dehydrogenase (NAD+)
VAQEDGILAALHQDLNKPAHEAAFGEIGLVLAEIDHATRHLRRWMRPRRVSVPMMSMPGSSSVEWEPLGVALILGAWNYPVQLLLSPLVAALAAGNCAVLKPSELAPHTAAALAKLIGDVFPPEHVAVLEGGQDLAEGLLKERFDNIFYTGGSRVGRIILAAADRHLTRVTLVRGGMCP